MDIWAEIKRRKVIRAAIAYVVVAWLLVQVAVTLEPALGLPSWFDTFVVVTLILGFPVMVLLAWGFDLTPDGVKRTPARAPEADADPTASAPTHAAPEPVAKPPPSPHGPPSIAVLPFANMSPDPDQEYFSDGLSEELLNELAQIKELRVAARTSSFHFKGRNEDLKVVAHTLGVSHVLEGSVRRDGDRLRITAQLINAETGYHLWSQTYARTLDDVFAIQEEIARAVAKALSVTLGLKASAERLRGTQEFAAYDHFLRGRSLYEREDPDSYRAALVEYRRALAIDPSFGAAWAGIAVVDIMLSVVDPKQNDAHLADQAEAVRRALGIAPDRWETHAQHGVQLFTQKDWLGADAAFERAARLEPASPVEWADCRGAFLSQVGRVREAIVLYTAARDVDPLSLHVSNTLALNLDFAGDIEAAVAEHRRAESLEGGRALSAFTHLTRLLARGDRDDVRDWFARFPATGDASDALARALADVWESRNDALAVIRGVKDDPAFAGPHRLCWLAVLAGYYEDADLALELMRDEYVARRGYFTMHMWHPLLAEVRRTAGFKQVLIDIGLAGYWRESGHWGDFARPLGEHDFECFG